MNRCNAIFFHWKQLFSVFDCRSISFSQSYAKTIQLLISSPKYTAIYTSSANKSLVAHVIFAKSLTNINNHGVLRPGAPYFHHRIVLPSLPVPDVKDPIINYSVTHFSDPSPMPKARRLSRKRRWFPEVKRHTEVEITHYYRYAFTSRWVISS